MKNNFSRLCLLNYLYIVVLELIYKFFIYKSILYDLPYLLAFSLVYAVILTTITNLFGRRLFNKLLTYLIWIGLFIIFLAEIIYYSFYQTIFSYQALSYGSQVAEYYSSIFSHILSNWYYVLIMLITIVGLFILSRKFTFKRTKFKTVFIFLFLSLSFAFSSLVYKAEDENSLYKLIINKNDIMETTNSTGLLTAISLDVYKNIVGFEEKIEINIDPIEPVIVIPEEKKTEYNITNIDFDTLIANEKDESVKTLHKYFSTQNPTNKNEMTGIFKDKNLIFITAEAFYPIAVDKDITPTLYKLVNEGIKFNNFYQPIYGCSTSDGEFVNLLGLLPGISTCSMDKTHDVYLPYVIGNSFKKYGYDTYAIHGWTYTYYHRDKSYPNLGFDKYYGYDSLKKGYKYALPNIKYSWPTSDIDVINSAYPIFSQSSKYVTYMMSISGHLQYSWGGNAISRKNKSVVKDIKANEKIKAYIAANVEFDRSLEILLKLFQQTIIHMD